MLAEARSSEGKGNVQSTAMTVALAEKMATAALTAMHDSKRAIADKLTSQDGMNAPGKQQKMHRATVGAHVANDRVESIFGSYDYVGHIFRGTSVENLSGLAQQMRNHDFIERPDGFFHRLSERLQQSLVSFAQHEALRARKAAHVDLVAHDAAKLARREERVVSLLNSAVADYAYSKELYTAWYGAEDAKTGKWVTQAARTRAEVDRALVGKPESEMLLYLRKQIEMRVIGLGWSEFATRWSSGKDAYVGSSEHLRAHLVDKILQHEAAERRLKQLPEEAALPQQVVRELGQLGTLDEDAAEIEKKAIFSTEELKVKAEAEVQRRLAAGISDSIEALNGNDAPAFDQALVGRKLEVLWPYTDQETGEKVLIWAEGRVARVADGLSDKRSKRAQVVLPAGMVLWAWDADPEFEEPAGSKWLALLPKKFNPQGKQRQVYSWRLAPSEFSASAAPTRDERRRNVRRADAGDPMTDDES